jgi:methylated-DNA-[protein]-cysteine S-methyltransferase
MLDVTAPGFTLFDTSIGRCAIAWSDRGIVSLQLPARTARETRALVRRRWPRAVEAVPPAGVQRAIDAVLALLAGRPADLSPVTLDLEGVPPFHRRVYEVARTIPPGATLGYGDIAAQLGVPGGARAVGQALGRNPVAIIVPCHRVLAARGGPGGFSAEGGLVTKQRLLAIEGVTLAVAPVSNGHAIRRFDPAAAVEHLRAADPRLRALIDRVGPCRLRPARRQTLFDALAAAIVSQQLTGRAAATIFARLCALWPGGLEAQVVHDAPDERLRGAGLSGAKQRALRDLARRTLAGELPSMRQLARMDDDEIVERLIVVRGIGRWTVEMLLIFRLGRPDVLPLDDYGVRKGFAKTFGRADLPSRAALERRGARWRPYRSVASWYLWRA